MILVRHGLMIIGETLSGKTSSFKALSQTLSRLADSNSRNESKVFSNFKILLSFFEEI